MTSEINLTRFVDAQEGDYDRALAEINNGRKQSHWMWYIFPQISGLGFSEMAIYYAINDLAEAKAYLDHPVLGSRLIDIANAMLRIEGKTASQVMGSPDDLKLRSSMTLFSLVENADPVFQAVLTKFFNGQPDSKTLAAVKNGN
ncbi:DUF1810 domain-containing protein [Spirosoma endophyticum]|uniref:Uncharacterized protein, DUF1810 family n=1 Tax=Spirosoma endophyticum TaxID=662367 RepID=A0A1I1M2B2_9BACT|nr:DUF1810 domain-containing protein [Spirosoma endophyticum]SFC75800.1 Uncharacterized protein, DUF1810 family [Spirosoma endophyticum]